MSDIYATLPSLRLYLPRIGWKDRFSMYNCLMPTSLETQEIMIAFAIDNKDNLDSWGKYDLEELKDAYADMPEDDKASTTGQRIKDRVEELEKVEINIDRPEETADQIKDDSKDRNQKILIGIILAIIAGLIIAGLSKLFF